MNRPSRIGAAVLGLAGIVATAGNSLAATSIVKSKHDNKGRVIEEIINQDGKIYTRKHKYDADNSRVEFIDIYDDSGRLTRKQFYLSGKLEDSEEFVYDDKGKIALFNNYDDDEKLKVTRWYEEGHLQERGYGKDGKLQYSIRRRIDGQDLIEMDLNRDGVPNKITINKIDGSKIMTIYGLGRIMATGKYDKNGKVTNLQISDELKAELQRSLDLVKKLQEIHGKDPIPGVIDPDPFYIDSKEVKI